ncbi:MAG: 50S ribosomal protein L5 [Candidatus Micrarchaeia archaeon]
MSDVMREIIVDKVTLNIGVGASGQPLENAKALLARLTGRQPVATRARVRNPVFKIKKGEPIGAKVTLRGRQALDFLRKALDAVNYRIPERSFDERGNFSFGVKEYIDFPGAKYDPKLGMLGFDVCVTLARRGYRVARKRRARSKVGKSHLISKEEGLAFARTVLKVTTT